jgi:hypothetical protein
MALHINNPKANKLARKLAKQTGETLTDAVIKRGDAPSENAKVSELLAIAERATGLRALGKSSRELVDELYDEHGLPR